jgi:hypothetical protein
MAQPWRSLRRVKNDRQAMPDSSRRAFDPGEVMGRLLSVLKFARVEFIAENGGGAGVRLESSTEDGKARQFGRR